MIEALPSISSGELDLLYLRQLLGTDTPLILEIGANNGWDTLRFLRAFPSATVCAFEPDPRALAKFKAHAHPRVRLFEMAIGAEDGEAEFHMSDGHPDETSPMHHPLGWDCQAL